MLSAVGFPNQRKCRLRVLKQKGQPQGSPLDNSWSCDTRLLLLFAFDGLFGGSGLSRWGRRRGCVYSAHAVFKAANAFAQALHDLGDATAAEEDQHDRQYDQPVENTKLTHNC